MEPKIFKNLFETHYSPLCNMAFRILGDIDQAEDVVQDVFVKIWNQPTRLDSTQNVSSYIYTMVKNQALQNLRREGIGAKVIEQVLYLAEKDDQSTIDEEEIEKYRLLDQIYVSIRQLPPKCGEVFTLAKVNGLTYSQIAEQLNISVKTVENQVGKALKLLRNMVHNK